MSTPNENYPRKSATEMEYHEKAQWTKDENIIAVMGGLPGEVKRPIGFIKLVDYDEQRKPILASIDLDGNEIFERTSNLYVLKKQFRDHEARLTKALIIHEAAKGGEITPSASEQIKEQPEQEKANGSKTIRRSRGSKDNSQEVSH